MDIRQSGITNINLQPVNTQKTDFMGIGEKAGLPSDTFTFSSNGGENLISPGPAKSGKQGSIEKSGKNAVTGTDTGEVSTEKQAYDIIAANAKDTKEAEADFLRFLGMLEKDMNPAEMAGFFACGDKFYEKGNKSRDQLITISMKEIHDFISDKGNNCKGTSREERVECAKILNEAIPPSDQKHIFGGGDALRPFSYILETLNDNKTETAGFNFGRESLRLQFSPPGKPDPGIVEATKMFAGWMKTMQNAENRESPVFKANDDTDGFHALKIIRSHFHYDPDKMKELESLMGVTGSPWTSLGIMMKLEEVDPELRGAARNIIMREAGKKGMTNAKIAEGTAQVVGLYSLMQPGEDQETFRKSLSDIVDKMVEKSPLNKLPVQLHLNIVNEQLKLFCKLREKGEPVTDSYFRFNGFGNKMQAMGLPLKDVKDFERFDRFYGMLGEKKSELLDGMPGAKTYLDVNKNVLRIMDQVWVRPGNPPEQAPDLITVGMQMRKPGQTLEEVCKTLAEDYKSIGDLSDLQEIERNVDQGIKDGKFQGLERQKIKEEVVHRFKMRKMMGDRSGHTIENACDEVIDAHNDKPEEKAIQQTGDYVIIGGVKLDVKRRG